MKIDKSNSLSLIYSFNPFKNVFLKQMLDESNELFPDKLRNAYGYPFYVLNYPEQWNISQIRRTNRKTKILIGTYYTTVFVEKMMNLSVVAKNVKNCAPIRYNILEKWNLDFLPVPLINSDYSMHFLISTEKEYKNYIAFVPVIPISRVGIFIDNFLNVVIVFGIVSVCLYVLYHFKTTFGSIRMFNSVRIFFGQSINNEPQKTIHRIILLTIYVASVKLMNDFLLDVLLMQIEKKEMPFKTYKDLYDSRLKTYSGLSLLKDVNITDDPYLLKTLNETSLVKWTSSCLDILRSYQNLSCIIIPTDLEYTISLQRNSDGSPIIKAAEPPIFTQPSGYYWFADGSPYAMKFVEIDRRIKEGDLMRWPAFVYENVNILTVEKLLAGLAESVIKTEHLLTILSFGYTVSLFAFIFEFSMWIRKLRLKYFSN